MAYQDQSDLYRNPQERSRIEMCVREQGYIFSADLRADIKSLGQGVVAGNMTDIDSVIAAVCVSPNWSTINEDAALLAAVQGVWPTVAAARYPSEV